MSTQSSSTGNYRLEGVVVPMMTPFTATGEVDRAATARLARFLAKNGVDAIFVLGSSGEFVALPWERQRQAIEAAAEAVKGKIPVCAGVSSNCMDEAISHAREAARSGADFAVALPPFYFRLSQAELIRYFSRIADESPIPVVMYNMPFRTNNNIEPATVETLSAHPHIAGIKDTVPDMARTLDVLGRVGGREDFVYLHGNELLSLPAMLYGARGMVPAIGNFAPALMVEAAASARRGETAELPRWQRRIQGLMRVFGLFETRPQDSTALRLQAIKSVLRLMGLCEDYMAQLDERPSEEDLERVRQFMREEGIGSEAQ